MDYSRVKQIIEDIGVAMLTTAEADGTFRSRPMLTASCILTGEPGKTELWFMTGENSPKADEILQDPRVNITYSDIERKRHISISGSCEVVHDPVRVERYWRPEFQVWLPEGPRADLALLRVSIDQIECWEMSSGILTPLKRVFGLSPANETHDRADLRTARVSGTRRVS